VAACSGSAPQIVSASDAGIVYRIATDNQQKAESAANQYCRERNRTAQLRSVTPTGSRRSTMSFTCS
jgi:Tfp pilus assembly protein PilW